MALRRGWATIAPISAKDATTRLIQLHKRRRFLSGIGHPPKHHDGRQRAEAELVAADRVQGQKGQGAETSYSPVVHRAGSILELRSPNRTPGQAQRSQPLILGLGRVLPLGCSTLVQHFQRAGFRLTKKKPRPAFAVFAADVRLCPYGSPGNLFMCLDECLNERGELFTTSG